MGERGSCSAERHNTTSHAPVLARRPRTGDVTATSWGLLARPTWGENPLHQLRAFRTVTSSCRDLPLLLRWRGRVSSCSVGGRGRGVGRDCEEAADAPGPLGSPSLPGTPDSPRSHWGKDYTVSLLRNPRLSPLPPDGVSGLHCSLGTKGGQVLDHTRVPPQPWAFRMQGSSRAPESASQGLPCLPDVPPWRHPHCPGRLDMQSVPPGLWWTHHSWDCWFSILAAPCEEP